MTLDSHFTILPDHILTAIEVSLTIGHPVRTSNPPIPEWLPEGPLDWEGLTECLPHVSFDAEGGFRSDR